MEVHASSPRLLWLLWMQAPWPASAGWLFLRTSAGFRLAFIYYDFVWIWLDFGLDFALSLAFYLDFLSILASRRLS